MADFNEYKGVWVFCEQRQGALMSTDFELVSEARKLADELGCEVTGLLLGDNVEGIAKELGGYGADKVMVCDSPLLKDYTTDAYAKVVCDMVNEYKPEVLLIGATNIGRDLGPRCAARLHTGLTADATHLDIDTAKYVEFLKESSTIDLSKQKFDYEDRNLKMTRPAFGGHLMATIICPRFRPQMSTVRPGVMKKAPFDQAKADACQIVKPAFSLTADDIKTEVLSVEKAAEKLVDLIGADVIVSVGRGISKDVNKGIELAEQLAAALGGGVGYYMDVQEAKLRDKMRGTGVSVTRSGDNIILNMPNNVTFDSSSATLKPAGANTLTGVAMVLKEYPKTAVNVIGYTDSTGGHDLNMRLSQQRADSVASALITQGVDASRIRTQGLGPANPIASNSTAEGKAQNRRVEITLSPL